VHFPRAARRGALVAVLALGCCAGCASYTGQALQVREPLEEGNFEAARSWLEEKKPGGEGLPYLMELGLVLRYQEEYARSNAVFEDAERLVDELYTKSISREVLAFATSDETIPYDGEMWERVLVNYYRALNYIDLGQYDDALVECRKINHKLKVYVDASDDPPTYRTDAFAQYLTALLYEATGDLDDAWVSLRLADEGYAHYEEAYGVPPPRNLAADLMRLAEDLGEREELEKLRERFPDVTWTPTRELLGRGEIVLFYEEGFVPAKMQAEITVPILKNEYSDDHVTYAHTLSRRARARHGYQKTELEYLLRLAVPEYPPEPPGADGGTAVLSVGTASARTELAEDLDAISRHGLDDEMGTILFRSILRGLTKYALTRTAEKKKGDLAGTVVNIFTAALEKADTRSWITLPRTIQVARLLVEPGTHDVQVTCYAPGGGELETVEFQDVEVGAGEVRFLSHRRF